MSKGEPPKELDLGIDHYRVETKRGRMIRRDNWPLYFLWCFPIAFFWLGYAWWTRNDGAWLSTIGIVAMAGIIIGIGISGWLKRFD